MIVARPRKIRMQPPQALMDGNTSEASMRSPATSTLSTNPTYTPLHHRPAPPTCILCRRRKVKCNRQTPCSNCVRVGAECISPIPSRAPRGRQGGRRTRKTDGELLERVTAVEGLLKQIEASKMVSASHVASRHADLGKKSCDARVGLNKTSAGGLDKYLATSFWETLSEEISGLKDVLDDSSNDEDDSIQDETLSPENSILELQQQQQQPPRYGHSEFIISCNSIENFIHPTNHQIYVFCDIYLANVDPILKILHAPSLRRYLQEDIPDLNCSPGRNGLEALRYAIYFAAVSSIEDNDCKYRTGENKAILLSRYRYATEAALAKADFVNTVEMSTLQALTIYLTAVRVDDSSRFMWTLVSLAIRIAQAMSLHLESTPSTLQPFEREMRRRLWWQICALDSHAAEDRASSPVITAESFNTSLPLHIDDRDIQFGSSVEIKERQGFTEMTFCLICHEVFDTVRQLNYVPARELGRMQFENSEEKWQQRVTTVLNIQKRIEEKYLHHLNLARPIQWTSRMVADVIIATMWLLIYRPLQRNPSISLSQTTDPGILGLAVDVLERAYRLYTDPAASSFRWLSRTHVQWHAIAVTLAELCVNTDGPMVERAWAILELIFHETAKDVADSNKGMLWRPVKKLMNRARDARKHYLSSLSAETAAPKEATTLNGPDHEYMSADNHEKMSNINMFQQHVSGSAAFHMEAPQQSSFTLPAEPFNWDPWLAAATTNSSQQISHLDVTAWTTWGDFIDDFQGQDQTMSGLNEYASGTLGFWPYN